MNIANKIIVTKSFDQFAENEFESLIDFLKEA